MDYCVIQENRPDPDQCIGFDPGPMNYHIMSDGNIIADLYYRFVVGGVQGTSVLDIHPVPDPDGIHIASQDRVKPNRTIVSQDHITNDRSIVSQVTVQPDVRGKSPDRLYQCHFFF
jgi:hypothetical protein